MSYHIVSKNNIEVAQLDVTSEQEVSAIVKEIVKKDGSIDIVINNAGLGLAGCLESVTVDEGKALFDINVWGPVRVIQAGMICYKILDQKLL